MKIKIELLQWSRAHGSAELALLQPSNPQALAKSLASARGFAAFVAGDFCRLFHTIRLMTSSRARAGIKAAPRHSHALIFKKLPAPCGSGLSQIIHSPTPSPDQ